jgi:hypothetical protein
MSCPFTSCQTSRVYAATSDMSPVKAADCVARLTELAPGYSVFYHTGKIVAYNVLGYETSIHCAIPMLSQTIALGKADLLKLRSPIPCYATSTSMTVSAPLVCTSTMFNPAWASRVSHSSLVRSLPVGFVIIHRSTLDLNLVVPSPESDSIAHNMGLVFVEALLTGRGSAQESPSHRSIS